MLLQLTSRHQQNSLQKSLWPKSMRKLKLDALATLDVAIIVTVEAAVTIIVEDVVTTTVGAIATLMTQLMRNVI